MYYIYILFRKFFILRYCIMPSKKVSMTASMSNQTSHFGIMGGIHNRKISSRSSLNRVTSRLTIPAGAVAGLRYMKMKNLLSRNPVGSGGVGRMFTVRPRGSGGSGGGNVVGIAEDSSGICSTHNMDETTCYYCGGEWYSNETVPPNFGHCQQVPACKSNPKVCPSGEMLSEYNECLPICTSSGPPGGSGHCVGFHDGPCYNDTHGCFTKHFQWSCDSLANKCGTREWARGIGGAGADDCTDNGQPKYSNQIPNTRCCCFDTKPPYSPHKPLHPHPSGSHLPSCT